MSLLRQLWVQVRGEVHRTLLLRGEIPRLELTRLLGQRLPNSALYLPRGGDVRICQVF